MDEISEKVNQTLQEENYVLMPSSKYMLTATSKDWFKPFRGMQYVKWSIGITEKAITASAYLVSTPVGSSTPSEEETLNDDAGDNLTEYWRVRRKLEKICNNVMIITDIRKERKEKPQNEDEDEFKK